MCRNVESVEFQRDQLDVKKKVLLDTGDQVSVRLRFAPNPAAVV